MMYFSQKRRLFRIRPINNKRIKQFFLFIILFNILRIWIMYCHLYIQRSNITKLSDIWSRHPLKRRILQAQEKTMLHKPKQTQTILDIIPTRTETTDVLDHVFSDQGKEPQKSKQALRVLESSLDRIKTKTSNTLLSERDKQSLKSEHTLRGLNRFLAQRKANSSHWFPKSDKKLLKSEQKQRVLDTSLDHLNTNSNKSFSKPKKQVLQSEQKQRILDNSIISNQSFDKQLTQSEQRQRMRILNHISFLSKTANAKKAVESRKIADGKNGVPDKQSVYMYDYKKADDGVIAWYNSKTKSNKQMMQPCHIMSQRSGGRILVNKRPTTMTMVENENKILSAGGQYSPKTCTPRNKVAIIIPYRDREAHLKLFLRHMHPFLRFQQLDYTIFVVELANNVPFNRGALMNIGFLEARKRNNFDCYIFHDVDLLPEDTRNLYTCSSMPRHMSAAVDSFGYRLPYETLFGGVCAISKEHFERMNGYSNLFFGWGGEDDDIYRRIRDNGLIVTRYSMNVARYTMLSHKKNDNIGRHRFELLRTTSFRSKTDGINSLDYTVLNFELRPLFTWIYVTLNEAAILSKHQSSGHSIPSMWQHRPPYSMFNNMPNENHVANYPSKGHPKRGVGLLRGFPKISHT